jgi:hypothetical protein
MHCELSSPRVSFTLLCCRSRSRLGHFLFWDPKLKMPIVRPPRNPIGSTKEFKVLCIKITKTYKYHVSGEALRHLRLTMALTKTRATLDEALSVVFAALACKNKKKISLADLTDWLAPDAEASADSAEVEADEEDLRVDTHAAASAIPEAVYGVRRILDSIRLDGATYYLVDWKPTYEKRENISSALIATFNRERRALVRRTYIDDEAVEDNSLNVTEG